MGSILKVDDLRGNTAAGDITITSEGGSATMQLQKGLIKSWCLWELDSTQAITESFNVSSIADAGTGKTKQTFTNSFSSADYSPAYNGTHDGGLYAAWGMTNHDTPPTASVLQVDFIDYAASAKDIELASSHVAGDLA